MVKNKALIGHGKWLKWLSDNCPDISHDTASKWMKLSNIADVRNLENCRSLTKAYIATGIIPEPEKALRAIGTAEVDIFQAFVDEITKLAEYDLSDLTPERKDQVRGQLKAIEARL